MVGGKLSATMVGATLYKLFLKGPWVNKQLASSDFTFRKRKKWRKIWRIMELGEHIDTFSTASY
jgi:hypothetical protein